MRKHECLRCGDLVVAAFSEVCGILIFPGFDEIIRMFFNRRCCGDGNPNVV